MNRNADDDFIFGNPQNEEEVPLDEARYNEESLKYRELEIEENDKARKDKKYFGAFKLIVGCMVMLGIIYIIDAISNGVLKNDVSTVTDSIIEIIKTMIFTLSGYLFAKKENDN